MSNHSLSPDLQITSLLKDYETGARTVRAVLNTVSDLADALSSKHVWITRLTQAQVDAQLDAIERRRDTGAVMPLFGIPFAVKDNIDVAGLPTTAACPSFAYTPSTSATVVTRLQEAGAVLIGKTNLDQFATGLVGVRSPYGACSSAFNAEYVSGGSSSGSALAVAYGAVSFALGTDTAGSGRVPAGFNNIYGLKPTKGLISTGGVVPACRSLDCVSVFAGSAQDSLKVLEVAAAPDEADAYSRVDARLRAAGSWQGLRVAIPQADQLEFFGDREAETLFRAALQEVTDRGAKLVEFDFAPFRKTADLLYSGAWVAERYAAVGEFLESAPPDADPTVRQIVLSAKQWSAADVFKATYTLQALQRETSNLWQKADVMLLPTTGTAYTLSQLAEEPLRYNANLGHYTNFVNLLDLCGIALPAGFRSNRMPFGVTILGPAFCDRQMVALAAELQEPNARVGATEMLVAAHEPPKPSAEPSGVELAVVGAHLRGQPLHGQLTGLKAEFLVQTTTAACYRLYALAGTTPPKPGLVRDPEHGGAAIEVEVYRLSAEAFGQFTTLVPPPLAIGNLELSDGRWVKGFVCEPCGLAGAQEITAFGGWRRFCH